MSAIINIIEAEIIESGGGKLVMAKKAISIASWRKKISKI
jgi:hypothetical protein